MQQDKLTPIQSFKEGLEDSIVVLQKLAPHFNSFEDLLTVLKLAVDHDAQLNFLFSLVIQKK